MNFADPGELWTGRQLAAQLTALDGVAPAPACHVVFRRTRLADGSKMEQYEVPEEAAPLAPASWPTWLARHELWGSGQLRVSLLVIRETLDATGRVAACMLERRLGAVKGPFWGEPARVDFVGPARTVRAYRTVRNGRLVEVALSPQILPAALRGPEPLTGELRALERRFGPALQIIDSREPTLFEDVAGLSSIVHLRLPDGNDLACGIGWHGTTPFILVADFPRFDVPLVLPSPDEAAVLEALSRFDLVRHETRLDAKGLAVMARRRGGVDLFMLRTVDGRVMVEPHQPGAVQPGSADLHSWLRYIEAQEGLKPLDLYLHGTSSDLIVLTGDPDGHAWRHLVDADGVEAWRRPADDAAMAAVHRERLAPGGLARVEGEPSNRAFEASKAPPQATADSLLTKGRAYQAAITTLQAARALALMMEAGSTPSDLPVYLQALEEALEQLSVGNAASHARALRAEAEAGMDPERLLRDLSRLETELYEDWAQIRPVLLPPGHWWHLDATGPFGAEVETRFPDCAYDVEEAASCLAFRRPTAAVFHCMKVLERGLEALGRRLGLVGFLDKVRRWDAILRTVHSASPEELAPAIAQLQRIRRHWHATSLDPADKYTEAEAELVFHSVGAFMRALAEQHHEAGNPLKGQKENTTDR